MPKFKLPSIEELSPELADLIKRRDEIAKQNAPLRAERLAITDVSDDIVPREQSTKDREMRVAALLGHTVPIDPPTKRERLSDIDRRIADVESALSVVTGQMQSARSKAGAALVERVEPEFRDRVRSVCEALIAAHNANYRLLDLIESIEDTGLSSANMNQSFPFFLGSPKDAQGPVAQFLKEARRIGAISRSDIPQEFENA